MPNNQVNVTELTRGESTMAPLLLLRLMRDLEVLEEELRTAQDTKGQPAAATVLEPGGAVLKLSPPLFTIDEPGPH
jgi:hypothetical protein